MLPAPEPETYATMLVGIGLIGWRLSFGSIACVTVGHGDQKEHVSLIPIWRPTPRSANIEARTERIAWP